MDRPGRPPRFEFGQSSQKAFFWNGSYIQTGLEFSTLNGQLSSITLRDGPTGTPKTCPVSATVTLANCFTNTDSSGPALHHQWQHGAGRLSVSQVSSHSRLLLADSPAEPSPPIPGKLVRRANQSGHRDDGRLLLRPPSLCRAGLANRVRHPIESLARDLPWRGNLSFAPNYSAFFYRPQLSSHSLIVNSMVAHGSLVLRSRCPSAGSQASSSEGSGILGPDQDGKRALSKARFNGKPLRARELSQGAQPRSGRLHVVVRPVSKEAVAFGQPRNAEGDQRQRFAGQQRVDRV
jgi:hypothetical protein